MPEEEVEERNQHERTTRSNDDRENETRNGLCETTVNTIYGGKVVERRQRKGGILAEQQTTERERSEGKTKGEEDSPRRRSLYYAKHVFSVGFMVGRFATSYRTFQGSRVFELLPLFLPLSSRHRRVEFRRRTRIIHKSVSLFYSPCSLWKD
ncbi:hypothetical protein ANTRET_LOCUS4209 [Anthophora retusa]